MIDVDHFKAFNDTHGHDAGDVILSASYCWKNPGRLMSLTDTAAKVRLDLANCSLDDARLRAEDLRHRVAALLVPYRRVKLSGPTISCGVAAFPDHGTTPADLIHVADRAFYWRKTMAATKSRQHHLTKAASEPPH